MMDQKSMHAMYITCSDVLALGTQLSGAAELPPAHELRRRIAALLDEMAAKGAKLGIVRDDIEDARYALVAFLDEQIFRSNWSDKQLWMLEPLQLTYFNENTAGEGFFARLSAIESRPERIHVLQIYYMCLALGFEGIYAVRGPTALNAFIETLGGKISRAMPSTENISPHGIPSDSGRSNKGKRVPVIALATGILVMAVIVFVAMRLVLTSSVNDTKGTMHNAATQLLTGSGR